jgi:hypothetical protein
MMATSLIDLSLMQKPCRDNLVGLHECLYQLVGEPFRFVRVSYGDELTLHFGDLRAARSAKLHKPYGAYILGLRGSSWLLKSGIESVVIVGSDLASTPPASFGKPLAKQELEAGNFVAAESRVLSADAFIVKPVEGFGLQLRMSDGSNLLVLPMPAETDDPDTEEPLPRLADWELTTPRGLLKAGPDLEWTFSTLHPSP